MGAVYREPVAGGIFRPSRNVDHLNDGGASFFRLVDGNCRSSGHKNQIQSNKDAKELEKEMPAQFEYDGKT